MATINHVIQSEAQPATTINHVILSEAPPTTNHVIQSEAPPTTINHVILSEAERSGAQSKDLLFSDAGATNPPPPPPPPPRHPERSGTKWSAVEGPALLSASAALHPIP